MKTRIMMVMMKENGATTNYYQIKMTVAEYLQQIYKADKQKFQGKKM